MSRVDVTIPAPAAVAPAKPGGRSAASDDGASFEVAIRSQLDSGRPGQTRSTHPRPVHERPVHERPVHERQVHERSDPADPRDRSAVSERSQRPVVDTVFERPDRPSGKDSTEVAPASQPSSGSEPQPVQQPAAQVASSAASAATVPAASGAVPAGPTTSPAGGSGAAAPGVDGVSSSAGSVTAASAAPATVVAPATQAEGSAATDVGHAAATPTDSVGTTAVSTPAGTSGAPGSAVGTQAVGQAAGQAAASSTSTSQPTTEGTTTGPSTTPTATAGSGQAGADGTGAGQTGSGQGDGALVPTLVHGRPPALGGAGARAGLGTDAAGATAPAGTDGLTAVTTSVDATTVGSIPVTAVATSPVLAPASAVPTGVDLAAAATVPTAPTTGTASAVPVTTAPLANPVVPLPPQTQVLNAMSPMFTAPDGTHQVTVHLEPENLGKVRVQLTLSGGEVALHLVAADAATRETLRQGLPELRAQLEQTGLRTAGMDVQSGSPDLFGQAGAGSGTGAGSGAAPRAGHGAIPGHRGADTGPATPNPTSRSLPSDVALDVRM
ncbi:hypothetical protein GCM10009867_18580 [Pedococcus aerophilus]|uniref:Flagellar hook-length control protein-like C-terminal domain-containing protein n=1 Tax=Pedococcus aerophilus TaxID=436356 RepID=A0ABP6H2H2_9MICO